MSAIAETTCGALAFSVGCTFTWCGPKHVGDGGYPPGRAADSRRHLDRLPSTAEGNRFVCVESRGRARDGGCDSRP